MKNLLVLALAVLLVTLEQVKGHGRLVEPPSRSTAWRYNFNTPKNYNDHEIYCGGWSRQHQTNKGKCGVCGDAWDLPVPRPNEGGGEYGTGVIVRTYPTHSVIDIGVELTANHQGFFEFHLCPHNDPANPESEECFNRNILQRADGQGARYYPGPGSGIVFTAQYLLPADLTCSQCVLRWRYVAGNNWGTCDNGTSMMGCGPQEEFRACADVQITKDGIPGSTTSSPKGPKTTSRRPSTTSRTTTTTETSTILEPSDTSSTSPGSYAGVVIALATLLFAILFILGVIAYFYRGHAVVKQFLRKHFQENSSGSNPSQPHVTVVQDPKPSVPPPIQPRRIYVRNQPVIISEPIQVAINGIPVDRDGNSVA